MRKKEGNRIAYIKGAPELILERCSTYSENGELQPLSPDDKIRAEKAYHSLAKQGLRTLAIAERSLTGDIPLEVDSIEQSLTLLGIVGIIDPPRRQVPKAIEVARQAGIGVVVITGDALDTASAIAERIGLSPQRTLTGSELERMSDKQLVGELKKEVLFARTTPEHKLRIVKLLQQQGEVVAMTGDGVNDAPALRRADIGISMGIRGTDVAKGASDIILTDDNFASIVKAIEEGRRQYDNIQKFVRYLLSF